MPAAPEIAVAWQTEYPQAVGNSLGYSYHNDNAREAMVAEGVRMDACAPVAVHVCPPHRFEPVPGKASVVYCAWEAPQLPENFRVLKDAAAVCVTATYLVEPFRQLLGDVPVHYVPLGVKSDVFRYVDRRMNKRRPVIRPRSDKPFRFLWVGAPNARKGAMHVMEAWKVFDGMPGVELYLKTTVPPDSPDREKVTRIGNVITDTRKVPIDELVRLYHSAHCFVFPSVAEGFGLTLGEALATGLPAIVCPWSSMPDLVPNDQYGYHVRFKTIKDCWTWEDSDGYGTPMVADVEIANPDTAHLAEQMIRVARDPLAAFDVGLRGSERIRTQFTWKRCGQSLRKVVEEVYEQSAVAA